MLSLLSNLASSNETYVLRKVNVIDRCGVQVYSVETISGAVDDLQSCAFFDRQVHQEWTMSEFAKRLKENTDHDGI